MNGLSILAITTATYNAPITQQERIFGMEAESRATIKRTLKHQGEEEYWRRLTWSSMSKKENPKKTATAKMKVRSHIRWWELVCTCCSCKLRIDGPDSWMICPTICSYRFASPESSIQIYIHRTGYTAAAPLAVSKSIRIQKKLEYSSQRVSCKVYSPIYTTIQCYSSTSWAMPLDGQLQVYSTHPRLPQISTYAQSASSAFCTPLKRLDAPQMNVLSGVPRGWVCPSVIQSLLFEQISQLAVFLV